tara:strand:- start:1163 stop:2329 length:1167 start_codon:yes stop_codon:yes gene_type:complete
MANGFAVSESTRQPIVLPPPPKKKPIPTIGPDPRGWRQRKADEFYHSGHPAAGVLAALDDILPGIPFKDIIPDPPNKLIGKAEGVQPQKIRDLMNVVDLAMLAGSARGLSKKAVGRVVTNLFEPVSYTHKVRSMLDQLQEGKGNLSTILDRFIQMKKGNKDFSIFGGLKGENVPATIIPHNILTGLPNKEYHPSLLKEIYGAGKKAFKSVKSDKPIYRENIPPFLRAGDDMYEGRELPYRKMFGLKPRFGKDIYIKNPDGTYSFNPKSKWGEVFLRDIKRDAVEGSIYADGSYGHPVMGGYSLKPYGKSGAPEGYEYEDIWDFALNNPGKKLDRVRVLRAVMNKLSDPVTIKGRVDSPTSLKKDMFGNVIDEKMVNDFLKAVQDQDIP